MSRPRLTELDEEQLQALVRDLGAEPFRARQVVRWVLQRGVTAPTAMSDLPAGLRARLEEHIDATPLKQHWERDRRQGTEKLLLALPDGASVEAVLIMEGGRTTACLSSQVGCPVGCRFCASGLAGLERNLSAGEILEQFLAVRERARERNRRLSNVVMMGMGEPMLNMEATLGALAVINDPTGGAIGARHLTISTVGLKKGLERLRGEGRQYTLAISLHAPDDVLRNELIPFEGALPVARLAREARDWFDTTGREVTFEYVLLSGVNDGPAQARGLAALLEGVRCTVNLIPYNTNPGLGFARPSPDRVDAFARQLRQSGLKLSVRKQKGDDILAACGQLRLRATRERD